MSSEMRDKIIENVKQMNKCMSKGLEDSLKLDKKTVYTMSLNLKNKFEITFCCIFNKKEKHLLKNAMQIACDFFKTYEKYVKTNSVEISIILNDYDRIMDNTENNDCRFNMSNGYTATFGDNKMILVSRKQDAIGLLIHELEHYLDIDGKEVGFEKNVGNEEKLVYCEGINNAMSSINNALFQGYDASSEIRHSLTEAFIYLTHKYDVKTHKDILDLLENQQKIRENALLFEYIVLRFITLLCTDKIFENEFPLVPKKLSKYEYLSILMECVNKNSTFIDECLKHFEKTVNKNEKYNMGYYFYE